MGINIAEAFQIYLAEQAAEAQMDAILPGETANLMVHPADPNTGVALHHKGHRYDLTGFIVRRAPEVPKP